MGFAVDFAYFAHEDQIYRRFGQHPPTDFATMKAAFQRTFLIEAEDTIPLKTRSPAFGIDEWASGTLDRFVAWYAAEHPDTVAILVNYVFLSRCLEQAPGMLKLIDTHDRFADRQLQYRPFRAEPNFFYTDRRSEALALDRADVVLAIQSEEAAYFASLTNRPVLLLPPAFPVNAPFAAPSRIARIGFVGHGNDPNLFSISKFAHEWAAGWTSDRPQLRIAGEICNALGGLDLPGVQLLGYIDHLSDFYRETDVIVAPMLMGSGLKMKVGEALSYGVPVVGTELAFEGFGAEVPAHRCAGVREVKATILSLQADATGLAVLTEACATLVARFNATAHRSEAELGDLIRAAVPSRPHALSRRAVVSTPERMIQTWPTCIRSAGSVVTDDPGLGRLLATERIGEEAARAARYAPERRRWYAESQPPSATISSVGALHVAFSPEWIREKRLPREVRESAARAFRDVQPDWTTHARRIGGNASSFDLALVLPSYLLTASRAVAAFLIEAATDRAHELTVDGIAPLSLSPGYAFDAERTDLTPVPAAVHFSSAASNNLSADGTVLFLTDDMIGRIVIVNARDGENIGS